tara:strand:- start:2754 stop:3095 length:342 start_codon:yes stop_codon:yes gene_type:complete
MSDQVCYNWGNANFCWGDNPYTWREVCLALEVVGDSAGDHIISPNWLDAYNKLDTKKKREFVTLICKVKKQDELTYYKEFNLKQEKYNNKKAFARDIRMTVEDVLSLVKVEIL